MKSKPLLGFFVLCFLQCTYSGNKYEGHYYNKRDRTLLNEADLSKNQATIGLLKKENFIDFFKDGRYLMYINELEAGDYSFMNDTVYFKSDAGEEWHARVQLQEELGHFHFPNTDKLATLNKVSNRYKWEYPFTYELNRWREISSQPLTENELIEKFQNYCAFMVAYMRWSQKMDEGLSLKHLSGPLQYANNGLMMRRLKDTGRWCKYFYEGDCKRMDQILRHYFDGLVIEWNYTHDRILMLSDALQQISKDIEKHKQNFTK